MRNYKKLYKKAMNLLELATGWAEEMVGSNMKEDSPTMYHVSKEYEKLSNK